MGRIVLLGVSPLAARVISVPDDLSLEELHDVLQPILDWRREPFYCFRIHGQEIGPRRHLRNSLRGSSALATPSLEAARRLPGRVVGLIPVDTSLNVEQTNSPEEVAGLIGEFEKDYRGTAERFTRQYMFVVKSDPALVDRVAAKNASAPPEIAIPCLRAAFSYDARPTLREVRVPAHAVNADRFPTDVEANRRHFASYELTLMRAEADDRRRALPHARGAAALLGATRRGRRAADLRKASPLIGTGGDASVRRRSGRARSGEVVERGRLLVTHQVEERLLLGDDVLLREGLSRGQGRRRDDQAGGLEVAQPPLVDAGLRIFGHQA